MATIEKVYLGDSVYASRNDVGQIVLTTENGYPDDPRNKIYLEPEVYVALRRFAARAWPGLVKEERG